MQRTYKVFIAREDDGTYSTFVDPKSDLNYGLVGEGATVAEAIEEWNRAYADMKKLYEEEGEEFQEASFAFVYDVPSFLKYYADRLTLKGLAQLSGISAAQLSQYSTGYRNPSPKTTEKIQNALHKFGAELQGLQLI